ncbi:MAG: DUF1778 domain-containing protein [Bifidobacteriaceae bacterium]|jgi:uncharacterized protein (DUF1778 family)|nr:DUF1778 domain-containing protein [Bifidobacteriaceae bacterium]
MSTVTKDQRLALRLTGREKSTIERAALVSGDTLTEFSVAAITDRAEEVLSNQPRFEVGADAWAEFTAALEAPPAPVPELAELFARPSLFE